MAANFDAETLGLILEGLTKSEYGALRYFRKVQKKDGVRERPSMWTERWRGRCDGGRMR